MFKALMGAGRSSSDVRSSASSKSGSRRKTKSSSSSTVSRKSSRGDDRDRGLGDLSAYPPAGSRSSKRYAHSAAGDSVASSYATAQPDFSDDRIVVERTPRPRESEYAEYDELDDCYRGERRSEGRRERELPPSRERERTRSGREDSEDRDSRRRERERTQWGDPYFPPLASGGVPAPGPGVPPFGQMPMTEVLPKSPPFPITTSMSGPPPNAAPVYDPHVQQQFPGQFPTSFAEPYRPPNPAGEAADYYGDQGQSVAEQPGVRPKPPLVIPNSQSHLMSASPSANPPPEPSSMGQVGAAAAYFTDGPNPDTQAPAQPPVSSAPSPPKPSKPPYFSQEAAGIVGGTAAAAAYGLGSNSSEHVITESPTTYAPQQPSNSYQPPRPHSHSHSHGVGAAVGAAAAGAAAGYMLGHGHHPSSSADHHPHYAMQQPDEASQLGLGHSGPPMNPALYAAGAAGQLPYAASPLHPDHAAIYHGSPFQSGGLAFQQRQRGPLEKFIDFWRDPEGVGKFEEYTEAIGVCKYCFEPGTTSRDAPRAHNYRSRRPSSDRVGGDSRVDKLRRYSSSSSDDDSRRRKSSRESWLPALLGGYAVKSVVDSKDFDDTYSVRSGRKVSAAHDDEGTSASGRRSRTSRGVYKRTYRSRSPDRHSRADYRDTRTSKYEGSRIGIRSRSRSSSRSKHHVLRDAAIGAAIGTAAMSVAKSRQRSSSRSRSPRKARRRKSSSSSDSSFVNLSRPFKYSTGGGFGSFFSASSENRRKRRPRRRKSIFSFTNSSSSSLDADLAFGSGYAKMLKGSSKRRSPKRDKEKDVDAKLLALGATATALAASSPRQGRRAGELLGQGSRSGRSDNTSSASNDDWEDMDSDEQSSSVSSALAFGTSGHFASDDSHSSDLSSKWGWGWGRKNRKKSEKRRSSSSEGRFPTGAAVAAGAAGALGTAALASGYNRDAKAYSQAPSSSAGSLQQVAPVPTSDPSRFDAIPVSLFPPVHPPLVRPGPIPLQQPQPVVPVSQAVYASQGEPTQPYGAAMAPVFESPSPSYEIQSREFNDDRRDQKTSNYREPSYATSEVDRRHRRSDSTPVFHTDPLEGSTVSSLKRRSTAKDQASVQFDLTQEQEDKERRLDRLEQLKRDLERDHPIRLIDREQDTYPQDIGYRSQRYGERDSVRRDRSEGESKRARGSSSSSWVGPVAAGAVGATAAATVLSGRSSNDGSSETSERLYSERREQRRAERRRASDNKSALSDLPERPRVPEVIEEYPPKDSSPEPVKTSAFRDVGRRKSVYDDYATFFTPEELRRSPDNANRQETPTMPTIIEIEPRSKKPREQPEEPLPETTSHLPWPVPVLRVIEPTPPHSVTGSVRDVTSPQPPEASQTEQQPERQPAGSRVSWGKHEMHEYEVPSTSSERDSIDLGQRQRDHVEDTTRDPPGYSYIAPSASVHDDLADDIEFAATVAAAAQAAGFDPSFVMDDPTFRVRISPPGTESRERSISPTTKGPSQGFRPGKFHGFVEGEVESPETGETQFVWREPLYTQPEPTVSKEQGERSVESEAPTSTPQPLIEELEPKAPETVTGEGPSPVTESKDIQESPVNEGKHDESESPFEEVFFMPGGFENEESAKRDNPHSTSPITGEDGSRAIDEPGRVELSRGGSGEDTDDTTESQTVGDDDTGKKKKKKRRKRRSKRDSDPFEDTSSVATVPRSTDEKEKEKKSGGFLSSIFGSRVSEPVESKRSPEDLVSREVQSEVAPRTSEESSRRRKAKSSGHRSSSRAESLDNDLRRYDDDALDHDDGLTEDKENVNVESYRSSRQRREERRRQRYGDMGGLEETTETEKDRSVSQDSHREQPFLVEGPEMPPKQDDDGEYDGALGRSSPRDAEVSGLGLGFLAQRPRSHSTSPPSSKRMVEDTVPGSRSRSASPDPELSIPRSRRSSVLRSTDSPTAVPINFRRPPTSPRVQRSPSLGSPPAVSPGSPSQGRRSRPTSTEFKNSREIRPLWLVERHGASKIENQPDEPLPSLPSSKNTSVEDLTALRDENAWETPALSRHVPEGQGLAEEYYNAPDDLGSQQNTPTRATFGHSPVHFPRLSRKEELGYEFHSPSELLQDPIAAAELPPSPTILPSVDGSAVGVKDERGLENLPPLPESRPSTPEDRVTGVSDAEETTPTQQKMIPKSDVPGISSGFGFAGVVDAAVAAAVASGTPYPDREVLAKSQGNRAEDEETVRTITGDNVPVLRLSADKELPEYFAEDTPMDFAAVVDAAIAAEKGVAGKEMTITVPVEPSVPVSGAELVDDGAAVPVPDETLREIFTAEAEPPSIEKVREADTSADTAAPSKQLKEEPFAEDLSQEVSEQPEKPESEPITAETMPATYTTEVPSESAAKGVHETAEAQPEESNIEAAAAPSSSSKKKKNKKKKRGKSVDLGDQEEAQEHAPAPSSDTPAIDPELLPSVATDNEKAEDVPTLEQQAAEQIPVSEDVSTSREIPVPEEGNDVEAVPQYEDVQASEEPVAIEQAAPIEEDPSPADPGSEEVPTPEEADKFEDALAVQVPEFPSHEAPVPDNEPDAGDVKEDKDTPEIAPPSQTIEPESTPVDDAGEATPETGLSKKAKKKKKRKSKGAAQESPAEPSVEEGSEQPSTAVSSEPRSEPPVSADATEPTDPAVEATRSAEDIANPSEEQQVLGLDGATHSDELAGSVDATALPAQDAPLTERSRDHLAEVTERSENQPATQPIGDAELPTAEEVTGVDESSETTHDTPLPETETAQQKDAADATTEDKPAEPEAPLQVEEGHASREVFERALEEPKAESDQEEEQGPEIQAHDEKGPVAEEVPEPSRETVPPEPEQQAQDVSLLTEVAVPPPESETAAEVNEPKNEGDFAQAKTETPLSRKASKKKKKNKRKTTTETFPDADAADTPAEIGEEAEPQTEVQPISIDDDSKPTEQEDIPADNNETATELQKDEGMAPEPAVETTDDSQPADTPEKVDDVVPDKAEEDGPKKRGKKGKKNRKSLSLSESQPESEAQETKTDPSAEAAGAPLPESSGEFPPPDENQQQPDAGIQEETADIQPVDSFFEQIEHEPSQPVENLETNNSEPHVPEQPTIEPEAGDLPPTGKKGKKNKKKKQSISSTPDEGSAGEVVVDTAPATEAAPDADAAAETEAPAAPEQPSADLAQVAQEASEEMSRDTELPVPAEPSEGTGDQASEAAPPMTAAQKKKAKKEKKKKRQSMALEEMAASESVAEAGEAGSTAAPVDVDAQPVEELPSIQEPESSKSLDPMELEPGKPVVEEAAEQVEEQTPERTEETVQEQMLEQIKDEPVATEDPAAADQVTAEPEMPAQQESERDAPAATDTLPEELAATETQLSQEQPENNASVPDITPAAEQPVSLAETPQEPENEHLTVDPEGDSTENATTETGEQAAEESVVVEPAPTPAEIEPQEDTQQQYKPEESPVVPEPASETPAPEEAQPASKKVKKKKKKNRQSVSADEGQPAPANEDTLEVVETSADLAAADEQKAVDDTAVEGADNGQDFTQPHVEPGTTNELKGSEAVTEDPATTEMIESPVREEVQPAFEEGQAIPESPKEIGSEAATSGPNDIPQVPSQDTIETLPEELVPEPTEPEGQEPQQTEETQTASSKKKDKKKKKKKSQSASSIDEIQPASATEDVLQEPTESVAEPAITTEPEEIPAATEEDQPPVSDAPAEELRETEAQDVPPADEAPTAASKKKAKKDKKKRKSVSFANGEPSEQAAESSEQTTGSSAEPAVAEAVEATDPESTKKPVEDDPAIGQVDQKKREESATESPALAEPDESNVTESKNYEDPAPTMSETATGSAGEMLENGEEATADQKPSEHVSTDEVGGAQSAEEPTTPQRTELQIEGGKETGEIKEEENSSEPTAPEPTPVDQVAEPEPVPEKEDEENEPKSAKAKKKAKKAKRRQSKSLSVDTTASTQDTSEEKQPQDPSTSAEAETAAAPAEERSLETSEEQPSAESAIAPAEDDGKENQSHGTGLHGDNGKDLTWTDDKVSSQVEQQQQPSSPYPFQPEHESADVHSPGPVEAASGEVPSNEVESSGNVLECAGERILFDTVEEKGIDESGVVSGQDVGGEEEKGATEKKELDTEIEPVVEKREETDIATAGELLSAATEVIEPVEEQKMFEEGKQSNNEPEGVKEAEPKDQPAVEGEGEGVESAVPSRKLSKKQKKKQRQAQKSAGLQGQATEKTTETIPETAQQPDEVNEVQSAEAELSVAQEADGDKIENVEILAMKEDEAVPISDPEVVQQPDETNENQMAEVEQIVTRKGDGDKIENMEIPPTKEDESLPISTHGLPQEPQASIAEEAVVPEPSKDEVAIQISGDGVPVIESAAADPEPVVQAEAQEGNMQTPHVPETAALQGSGDEALPKDDTEGVEETVEVPAAEEKISEPSGALEEPSNTAPLNRKESKKKKKKAKKQAKEQAEDISTARDGAEEIVVDASEPATLPVVESGNVKNEALETERTQDEQVEADVTAPVDTGKETEVLQERPEEMKVTEEAEREILPEEQPVKDDAEREVIEPVEEKEREKVADEDLHPLEPEPEPAQSITRKLSKKEKRKLKKQAALESGVKDAEQPQEGDLPLSSTLSKEKTRDVEPPESERLAEQALESPSEQPSEAQEPQRGIADHEVGGRPQDEDSWPPIDWEKGKIDAVEQSSQSSIEAHTAPFEPEIPEYKESAIPEALLSRQPRNEEGAARSESTVDVPEIREEVKHSKVANIFPNLERGHFRRPASQKSLQSLKDGAEEETMGQEAKRDSAIQVSEAPIATTEHEYRGRGYTAGPALAEDDVFGITGPESERKLSPVDVKPYDGQSTRAIQAEPVPCELRRSPSIHGRHDYGPRSWSLEDPQAEMSPRTPLQPITERTDRVEKKGGEPTVPERGTPRLEMKPEHVLPRPETPVRKFTDNAFARRAWPIHGETEGVGDWENVQKQSVSPEQNKPLLRPSSSSSIKSSSSQTLRRVVHSASGDLRAAALAGLAGLAATTSHSEGESRADAAQPPRSRSPTDLNLERIASSSSYDPVTDKGKRPVRSMTDVYEGWGETPSSPRSPSRPPSVRHRRSMQHLQELEFRLDQLISENRELAAARDAAEDRLRNASVARRKSDQALNSRDADLRDREAELEQLKQSVEWFQKEVARLNEENAGLAAANSTLVSTHAREISAVRQASARELDELRSQNERLSSDLHDRIKQEIETALTQKNNELRRLREELESARDKVKELQQQIAASMHSDVIAFRGADYFEAACQKLCGHVQQWVLRFSKHSDHKRCRKLMELQDEKIADRFDNAVLDGSDTDAYLGDRVRRRDVFMSVVMTMVWEFIFTRYLFGMDREQRQKLKSLEKQLIDVGPRSAIHRWRATTLTLLSKRPAFSKQRDSDTEAVALEIFDTLSRLLPPPSHVEAHLLDSLRKVLRVAVSLSIEMRTQLAEYIMLPPLQPEYDTNGDLSRRVYFNASLMNERSGETTSNEELEAQQAVVRVVLFPLVVKKGNDAGEGDDEVVVCPAQVLVARAKKLDKMGSGDRMSIDASRSVHSVAPSSMMDMSNVI